MVALSRRSSESTRRWPRPGPRKVSPLWRAMTFVDRGFVRLVGRVEVTGSIPAELRNQPMLIAANHIGVFDPFVLTCALREAGVNPRFLLAGGLLDAPVIGWGLRQGGSIRVDRRSANVAEAFGRVTVALRETPGPVLVYPEGRISLTPGLWPEKGKSGAARIALAADVPVLTISQWGAHEAVCWGTEVVTSWRDLVPSVVSFFRAVVNRPTFRVHFGPLVDLSDLSADKPGDAMRAHKRIMQAITDNLVRLRADQLDRPRFHDPTRPTTSRSPWWPRA
ncbi:lysophospholipid acyltransferase family protein [Actinophytocola sp.]|uniref:lysophospholipid acyltransferase family protein n=1 Tax=Actinophytocola sp. TaxID=1872138 RepID=UPI0039C873F8